MRVFILSLLAVSSVHSHAINYPYHGQLLSYAPARGEFPVYNNVAQGYLRYYDNNGAERLVRYNYPEPLYGIRRYTYSFGSDGGNQLLRTQGIPQTGFAAPTYYQLQENDELAKAREENFRRWCEQRYQALKAEMEKLRFEGLKPSADMMTQIEPLEKIISSTTYTAYAEAPEIKKLRDEHLRIWNEARLKMLQHEADHLRFSKTGSKYAAEYGNDIIANVNTIVGETAEQKKAREEHLRIYNEQLAKVKQYEAEHKMQQGNLDVITVKAAQPYGEQQHMPSFELKSSFQQDQQQQQIQQTQQQQQITQISDTPEVIKAREEHLRLVNEAKLRAEAEAIKNVKDDGSYKAEYQTESGYKYSEPSVKFLPGTQQPLQLEQLIQPSNQGHYISDTPEVIKAREEHFRLVNEAKIRAQAENGKTVNDDGSYKAEYETGSGYKYSESSVKSLHGLQQPEQTVQQTNQGIQQAQQSSLLKSVSGEAQSQQQPTPIQVTPEGIKAHEDHLKVFNEGKLKAEQTQERIDSSIKQQQAEKAETNTAIIMDAEKLREEERLREEQRLMEAERLREAERMREEEKLREMERLRELERQKEDEKKLEAERLRLKEEEEKRMEMQRMEEQKRLKEEQGKITTTVQQDSISSDLVSNQLKTQQAQSVEGSRPAIDSSSALGFYSTSGLTSGVAAGGSGFVLSSQYKNNPYLLRFATQPGTTAYIIGEQSQAALKSQVASPNLYYLPATSGVHKEAPAYLRYTQSGFHSPDVKQQVATATLTAGTQQLEAKPSIASAEKISTYASSSSSLDSSSFGSSGSNLKLSYGASTDTAGLSELERATREHFRAHELALERLRLANANVHFKKDCN